ncbi:putative heterogeneous nuclear ribonucleoprotein 1-like [Capsicum annuum]|nr:putative heterogeneous nuclear ribonucleoprotein 1-like [Capsicum annuum]
MRILAATMLKQSLLMKQHFLSQLGNLALSSVKELNQELLFGRSILLFKSPLKGNSKFSICWTSPASGRECLLSFEMRGARFFSYVPPVYKLAQAGLTIWVLTGDKMETAINIGYACSLLRQGMRKISITTMNADSLERSSELGKPSELKALLSEKAVLKAGYEKLHESLRTKRYKIVNGVVEVESGNMGTGDEKGVPNFWLTAMNVFEKYKKESNISLGDEDAFKVPQGYQVFYGAELEIERKDVGSDTTGVSIIPMQLTGPENYLIWSRAMQIQLLGKNKLGLVDETWKEEDFPVELAHQWDRCNAIIQVSNRAYAMLIEKESQRAMGGMCMTVEGTKVAALLAKRGPEFDVNSLKSDPKERKLIHEHDSMIRDQRYEIVNGVDIAPVDHSDNKGAGGEKGVPNCWLTALKSYVKYKNEIHISKRDKEALKFLKDIKWCRVDHPKGFNLDLFFDTKPFIQEFCIDKDLSQKGK